MTAQNEAQAQGPLSAEELEAIRERAALLSPERLTDISIDGDTWMSIAHSLVTEDIPRLLSHISYLSTVEGYKAQLDMAVWQQSHDRIEQLEDELLTARYLIAQLEMVRAAAAMMLYEVVEVEVEVISNKTIVKLEQALDAAKEATQ